MTDQNPDAPRAEQPSAPPPPPQYPASAPPPPPYGQAYGSAPAYGAPAPQYSAPGYAPAPYGAGGYSGYAAGRTNPLAIVSLIASIAGIVIIPFLASIVGVVTGHMALGQIKRTGEGGRGLALAGTIIGWVGVAFGLLGLLLLLMVFPLFLTSLDGVRT